MCLTQRLLGPLLHSGDSFRMTDKPSGGELITGIERCGDLSPTIGFVLRLHVCESIQ